MSRTVKWEHPSDTYRQGQRMERKARPAGRVKQLVAVELATYDEDGEARFVQAEEWLDLESREMEASDPGNEVYCPGCGTTPCEMD